MLSAGACELCAEIEFFPLRLHGLLGGVLRARHPAADSGGGRHGDAHRGQVAGRRPPQGRVEHSQNAARNSFHLLHVPAGQLLGIHRVFPLPVPQGARRA